MNKVRLQIGDSTRGYDTIVLEGKRIVVAYGRKYFHRRMISAYRREEREVVTPAGDSLPLHVSHF